MQDRPQWALASPTEKRPRTTSGAPADSTDPTTWTDFETACRAAAERGWQVGYMIHEGDPFCCIDLDVKSETPVEDRARFDRIVATFDSYTERSRSGLGWHVWVRGEIGRGRKRDGVEVYSQERFIICTGDVAHDRPVAARQAVLDNMVGQMQPPLAAVALTGDDCPDFAVAERAARDDGELGRLWRGDWQDRYPTQSEADLALAKLLLPLTDSLRECWRTFRLSALGQRDKAGRPDYAASTLALARAHVASDITSADHGRTAAEDMFFRRPANPSRLRLLVDAQLDSLPPLRWLVKGVVPDAGIGAIYGASGSFKSFLTLDLLAHISNGREWFGHRVKPAPAVYIPFEGQGGIPNRIKAWRTAQTALRHPDRLATFDPDEDVLSQIAVVMEPLNLREQADQDRLVAGLKQHGWAGGVLCIDTLAHASAGIEENSSAMGEMIGIFRNLQQQLGGVILLVHHSGKDESRGMRGWSGLHAAMDFVVECQKLGEPASREATFSLAKVKDGTTGSAFGFRMNTVFLGNDEDGDPTTSLTVSRAELGDKSEHPFVIDAIAEAAEDDAFVETWVRDLMGEGSQPTGRWLEAARPTVKDKRKLTQKRLRDAICRLKAVGRLEDTPDRLVQNGKWLRAVDVPQA